jgi:hypothetical protein
VTERQDLKKRYAAAAKLRTKKVDEIRQQLGILPDAGDEEAVKFIARWRETGKVPIPAHLRTKTQRLLREWHSIHMACIGIKDELEQLGNRRRITGAEPSFSIARRRR